MSVYAQEVTRADARKLKFSGLRCDRILHNMEIWVEGVMRYEASAQQMATNPEKFQQAYAEIFGLFPDQVVIANIPVHNG